MLAFLMSPFAKWGATILIILALVGGMVFEVEHAIHKHDDAVKAQVTDQVKADALKEQAKNAADDQKFDNTVQKQQVQDSKALDKTKQNSSNRVQKAQKDISTKIANGTLQDRPASDLVLNSLDQISTMQAERKENASK